MFSALVDPLTDNRNLVFSELKAFADNNFRETQMMSFFFDRIENIVGKGENVGLQHFLLCPHCFQKASFKGSSSLHFVVNF